MSLNSTTYPRVIEAVTGQIAGNNVLGCIGLFGGFVLNSDASVKLSTGDISAAPDSGGAAGTYRVFFPAQNANIKSLDWINVEGFTPRTPTGVELNSARVCGYNYDTTKNQWYITVQIALLADGSVNPTPPQNFVVGVRAAVTYNPTANAL